jgi:pantoate--beta-alanine ligase
MRARSRLWHRAGETVGLVPTMGALHPGHMSLVARARAENMKVIVSIFVNPLQFGPGEDFGRYPRQAAEDLALLYSAGVDAVYMPSVEAMYPPGASTRVTVHGVSDPLEGQHRPGHFEGVATVVTKLFGATEPNQAYFGQKDAQQVAVVKRLVADLDLGVAIRVCPTVREADGLAISSRNAYLSPAERKAATSLSRALGAASEAYQRGEREPARLRSKLLEVLTAEPLAAVDYAEVIDAVTFSGPGSLAALAVRIGPTRLIDNHDLAQPYPG